MADKLEFRFDLLKGQTTIIEALDEASKKASGFKATIGDVNDSGTSFLKLSSAVAVGTAAFELAKEAGHKFIEMLTEGIHAAIEKENAINKLNNSLAQTGKYTAGASADIQAFAEEMRKTTRYTDDQILTNAAYLQSLTYLDTKGLKQATKASADLAAALGMDLNSATSLVAKSIEGNTGALSRYGIQVKKGATETENFANTLKALSQFSGRAEADANTFGGAVTKMGNALGEVHTSMGMVITQNPIFITTINKLSESFNNLSEYINANKGNLIEFINGSLKLFGESILKLSPVFNFIIESLDTMLGVIRLSIQGWSQLLDVMSGLNVITEIVGRFVTGLLEVPKGITQLIQYLAELASSSTMVKSAFDKAGISLDKVNKDYQKLTDQIEDLQVEVASVDFDKSTVAALNNMDSLLGKSKTFLKDQTDSVKKIGQSIIDTSNITLDKQKEVIRNNTQIYTSADNFFERIGKAFSSFSTIGNKLNEIFSKIDRSTGLTQFETFLDKLGPEMFSGITKGMEGARSILTSAVKGIGNMVSSGLGDALAPIFDMFSRGPEYTKKMVKEFVTSIPIIIQNIVDSIPALIEALLETLPEIMVKFGIYLTSGQFVINLAIGILKAFAKAPMLIVNGILEGLKSLPKTMIGSIIQELPKVIGALLAGAFKFVTYIAEGAVRFIGYIVAGAGSFVWEIVQGAGSFVAEILEGAVNFVGDIVEGAGKFIQELMAKIPVVGGLFGGGDSGGGIIGDIGGAISDVFDWNKGGHVKPVYAEKGQKIIPYQPKGTDIVPSMLTPGEYVVDRSTTNKLNDFLNNQQSSQDKTILTQILFELRKPQTVNTEIIINRKTFADMILELSRSNARLTV